MAGKRVLWRDRCGERVRERRRRQSRVMTAIAQADADGQGVMVAEVAAPDLDLSSWLMLVPAGEAMAPREAPLLEP